MNTDILLIGAAQDEHSLYGDDLHEQGYALVEAADVERAYALLNDGLLPHTVILNTELSAEAIALIQDIRHYLGGLRIIVIGNNGAEKSLAQSVGADAFLFRPLKPGRLAGQLVG